MTNIDLSGQQALANSIAPKLLELKNAILARRPAWSELSPAARRAWYNSGQDPILVLAEQAYDFLSKVREEMQDGMGKESS